MRNEYIKNNLSFKFDGGAFLFAAILNFAMSNLRLLFSGNSFKCRRDLINREKKLITHPRNNERNYFLTFNEFTRPVFYCVSQDTTKGTVLIRA